MSRQRPTASLVTRDPSPLPGSSNNAENETQAPGSTPAGKSNSKKDSNVKMPTFLGKFGAIELENKGSVARDHLALGIAVASLRSYSTCYCESKY